MWRKPKEGIGTGRTKPPLQSVVYDVVAPNYDPESTQMEASSEGFVHSNAESFSDLDDDLTVPEKLALPLAPASTGSSGLRPHRARRNVARNMPITYKKASHIPNSDSLRKRSAQDSTSRFSASLPSFDVPEADGALLSAHLYSSTPVISILSPSDDLASNKMDETMISEMPQYEHRHIDHLSAREHSANDRPDSLSSAMYEVDSVVDLASTKRTTGSASTVRSTPSMVRISMDSEELSAIRSSEADSSIPASSRSDSASNAFQSTSLAFKVTKYSPMVQKRRRFSNAPKYRSISYMKEQKSEAENWSTEKSAHYRPFSYSSEATFSTPLEIPPTKRISAPNSPTSSPHVPTFASTPRNASQFNTALQHTRLSSNGSNRTSSSTSSSNPLHSSPGSTATTDLSLNRHSAVHSPPPKRKRRYSTSAIDEVTDNPAEASLEQPDQETIDEPQPATSLRIIARSRKQASLSTSSDDSSDCGPQYVPYEYDEWEYAEEKYSDSDSNPSPRSYNSHLHRNRRSRQRLSMDSDENFGSARRRASSMMDPDEDFRSTASSPESSCSSLWQSPRSSVQVLAPGRTRRGAIFGGSSTNDLGSMIAEVDSTDYPSLSDSTPSSSASTNSSFLSSSGPSATFSSTPLHSSRSAGASNPLEDLSAPSTRSSVLRDRGHTKFRSTSQEMVSIELSPRSSDSSKRRRRSEDVPPSTRRSSLRLQQQQQSGLMVTPESEGFEVSETSTVSTPSSYEMMPKRLPLHSIAAPAAPSEYSGTTITLPKWASTGSVVSPRNTVVPGLASQSSPTLKKFGTFKDSSAPLDMNQTGPKTTLRKRGVARSKAGDTAASRPVSSNANGSVIIPSNPISMNAIPSNSATTATVTSPSRSRTTTSAFPSRMLGNSNDRETSHMGGFDGPLQAVEQRRVRRKQATEAPIKNGREEEQVAQCLKPRHLAPSRPSGALMAGLTATDASDSDASYSADVDGDDEEDSSVASLPAEFATGPSLHEPHYYRPRSGHQQGAPKPTRLLGDVKAEQGGAAGTSGASTSPSQPMFPPHVLAPNLPESARAPRRHTALQHQVLLPSLAHSLHPSLASAAPTTTTSSGTIDMLPALAAANAPFTRMGTIPHSHIPSNSNYASDTAALTDARYRSPRHGGAGYGTEDDVCYHSATESGFVVAAEQRMGQFSIAIQSATSLPPLAISSFARDFQTAHIESAPMPSENMLPLEQLQTSMDMSEPMQSDNGPVEEVGVTEENFSLPPPKASPESKHGREHAPVMRATAGLVQTYQRVQRNIKERHDLEEAGARSKAAKAPYYFPKIDEVLGGGRYKVVAYLGRGSFGAVVKAEVLDPLFGSSGSSSMSSVASDGEVEDSEGSARNASEAGSSNRMETDSKTPQMVAIKIGRKGTSFLQQGKREVSILERIHGFQATQPTSDLDLFVRALDTFLHEGHMCIVFELLADSLFDLVKYSWEVRPDRPGLSLRMVRKMTHQILCALVTLRNMKIIHSDLKPENIALAQPNRPRLKLLDFGSSCFVADSLLNQFPYIQSRYYRAPEVLLGTGYSCSIDMWSLGCIIAELYLGRPLFVGSSSITQLYCVIEVLGMPMDHVLRNAVHLSRYFHRVGVDANGHAILDPVIKSHRFNHTTIKDIIASKKEQNNPLHMQYFTDLIARMLDWDPVQRINPLEAINHNFILYGPKTSPDGAT